MSNIDPWKAASNTRRIRERKKSVRLAGNGPEKVHTLIKLHAWRGKAVYVYHLQKKELKRIDKPTTEEWETFSQLGIPVSYPPVDRRSNDIDYWVQFGKEQAEENGLEVSE